MGFCGIYCVTDCVIYRIIHFEDIEEKQKVAEGLFQQLGFEIGAFKLPCKDCQGPKEEI